MLHSPIEIVGAFIRPTINRLAQVWISYNLRV
jgi:hypothetical protein